MQAEIPVSTRRDIDLQDTIEALQKDDERSVMLRVLIMEPLADERILPYLEELLTDTTPCALMIPYRFGEVRWLAAHALAKEREALGISEPVILHNVVTPLNGIGTLAEEAGIRSRGGIEGILEEFAQLQALDKLPRYDLELNNE